ESSAYTTPSSEPISISVQPVPQEEIAGEAWIGAPVRCDHSGSPVEQLSAWAIPSLVPTNASHGVAPLAARRAGDENCTGEPRFCVHRGEPLDALKASRLPPSEPTTTSVTAAALFARATPLSTAGEEEIAPGNPGWADHSRVPALALSA